VEEAREDESAHDPDLDPALGRGDDGEGREGASGEHADPHAVSLLA
jgi:hypothetical protein